MGLTGKYDFPGISKLGAAGIRTALAGSKLAPLLKLGKVLDISLELLVGFLANKGLVLLNIGAIQVESHFDQKAFDESLDKAFKEIEIKGGREALTDAQKRDIDNEVISSARRFIIMSKEAQNPPPSYGESYSGG